MGQDDKIDINSSGNSVNTEAVFKQVGEYQVSYKFNENKTLEACVAEYVKNKIKNFQ